MSTQNSILISIPHSLCKFALRGVPLQLHADANDGAPWCFPDSFQLQKHLGRLPWASCPTVLLRDTRLVRSWSSGNFPLSLHFLLNPKWTISYQDAMKGCNVQDGRRIRLWAVFSSLCLEISILKEILKLFHPPGSFYNWEITVHTLVVWTEAKVYTEGLLCTF